MYVWGNKAPGRTLSLLLFIYLAVSVTSSAIPTLANEAEGEEDGRPTPQHQARTTSLQPLPAGARVTIAHGWVITARSITSIVVPVRTMSAVLELFFQAALAQLAAGVLRNRPPPVVSGAVQISLGGVRLALRAVRPAHYLTWEVCEIVVAQLLEDARMGFTGQFRSEWFHPGTGTLLYVNLLLERVGLEERAS